MAAGGCSIGFSSPHSYGEAFYSVTCSQRKYHNSRVHFVADSSAKAACGAGGVRSIPPDPGLLSLGEYPGAPAARLHTYGTYLIALFSCDGDCFQPVKTHLGKDAFWLAENLYHKVLRGISKLKSGNRVI